MSIFAPFSKLRFHFYSFSIFFNFCGFSSFFIFFNFFTLGRFNLHSHQIASICIFRYLLVELIFDISFLDLQDFTLFLVSVNRSQSFRITVDRENRFFTSPGTTFTFFITIFLVFPLAHRTFLLYFLM